VAKRRRKTSRPAKTPPPSRRPARKRAARAPATPRLQALAGAAQRAGLSFPAPLYWTTPRLAAIERAAPDFGSGPFDARALATIEAGTEAPVDFVVDGDSWFNHPFLLDVLDWFNAKNLRFTGGLMPGRTLAEMVQRQRYQNGLQNFAVRALLLSGGGNDLIGWNPQPSGASAIFQSGQGSDPAAYINSGELTRALDFIEGLLIQYAREARAIKPAVPIITHCYDWIVPKDYILPIFLRPFESGEWVHPQLEAVQVPPDQALRNGIARRLLDAANDRYAAVCAANNMTFVDLRGMVRGRWFDEIHPKNAAFEDIADALAAAAPSRRV
jgi:uncharacterized protein YodC (DUF2158 family)